MEYVNKLRNLNAGGKSCCTTGSEGSLTRWAEVVKSIRWRSCASRCSRVMLIAVNFVFLILGIVLVAIGLKVYLDQRSSIYVQIFTELPALGAIVDVEKIPMIFVGIGGLVSLVSFLGCCGACSDSVCFLSLYTFLLLAALLSQIILSVLAVVYQQAILQNLEKSMQRQIRTEYNRTAKHWNLTSPRVNHITMTWDIFQIRFNCCGAVGPRDYRFSAWFNETTSPDGVFVPPSCCVLDNDDFRDPVVRDDDKCQIQAIVLRDERMAEGTPYYPRSYPMAPHLDPSQYDGRNLLPVQLKYQGCQQSLIRWLRPRMVIVVVLTSATAILQVVHFMFACVLMTSLKKSHTECRWYEEDCE